MGLKNWLIAKVLKKKVGEIKKISPLEKSIDAMLAEEMKTMTSTNRTIDKLLKVKIMRQESQHTLNKIGEMDQELEDPEEEEGEDFEDQIKGMLMKKILGGADQPANPSNYGDPLAEPIPQPQNPLLDAVNSMTPEQMKQLKGKFLK